MLPLRMDFALVSNPSQQHNKIIAYIIKLLSSCFKTIQFLGYKNKLPIQFNLPVAIFTLVYQEMATMYMYI